MDAWKCFVLVLNRISHSFALLTREISWSALETNFIFPYIHACILYIIDDSLCELFPI